MARSDNKKKLQMNRNRVRKHRQKKKLLNAYENDVHSKINEINRDQNNSTSENQNNNNIFADNRDVRHKFNIENALQIWALKHRVTHMAMNDLLSILNSAGVSSQIGKPLPKDSRTILKTPTHVDIQNLTDGKLWYYGVQKCIENIFKNINRDINITLNFNFDGVPLYNSSKITFWPILSSIKGFYQIEYIFLLL